MASRRLYCCLGSLFIVFCILSSAAAQSGAYGQNPYDEYEPVEFVTGGVGAFVYADGLETKFDTSFSFDVRFGIRITRLLSLVPAMSWALAARDNNASNVRVLHTYNLRAHQRLTPPNSKIIPYIEGGFGMFFIDDVPDFSLVGGGGFDFRAFGSGSVGVGAYVHAFPDQPGQVIAVMLNFGNYFSP